MKIKLIPVSVFLFVATLPAIYFLLRPGFYEPHDLHHIADIFQMYRAAASGQFPPRLGPDFLWNFGYPLFNLYYVLPFYIGAGFYAITKSLTGAFEFVFIVSAAFSIFGMYLFLREFFGKSASFVGSFLYLYTPYRAVQIYVRGAMGEALAMAIVPFVFWGLARLIKRPNKINISILALCLAAFILSHNYLWLLTAPFMALFYLGLIYLKKERLENLKAVFVALLLGAGVSAYWWLPAVKEFKLVSGVTPFPLQDHFPFIKQLLLPFWGYGASIPGPYDGMSFQIGLVNLLVVVVGLGMIFAKRDSIKKYSPILILAVVGFVVSVAMMNIRTLPIWKLLPIYQFVQFPWRLLFLTTFFSAILASFVVETLTRKSGRLIGVAFIVGSLIFTWGYFRPSKIVEKPDDFYLSRMFATVAEGIDRKTPTQDYINWSEDYLLLPAGIEKSDKLITPKIIGDENAKILNVEKINSVHYKAQIEATFPSKVTFYSLYFPGWFAKLDGVNLQIAQGQPWGQIEVIVPSGSHTLEFYWAETPLRKTADAISLISLGAASLLIFGARGRKDATV